MFSSLGSQFVAGFGKGATSLPFWGDVYGFDMSSIGKEVLEDTARIPVVDVIEDRDLVTGPALLKVWKLTRTLFAFYVVESTSLNLL